MVSKKLKFDTILNTISFGLAGVAGLLINVIIAYFYDSVILGIFNLYFAIFIGLSQLVGAGIHFSVLKHITQFERRINVGRKILFNGLIATALNAVLWLVLIYLVQNVFKIFFTKEEYAQLIVLLLPAVFFYVLNKVILAFRNAKKQMTYYAAIIILRPILVLITLWLLIAFSVAGKYTILVFIVSEFIVFVILFAGIVISLKGARISTIWLKKHFEHGYKSAIGSVLIDINTRVDILLLGYFTNEKMVGIYSFASLIAEGFNQLPIVFRTVINPYLTESFYKKNKEDFYNQMRTGRNLTYKILVPMGLLMIAAYPPALKIIGLYPDYHLSIWPFIFLMIGTLISVGYAPFLMIFNQTGFPMTQSFLYFLIFITNLILNYILIPIWGINGSAIATGLAYAAIMLFIEILMRKRLNTFQTGNL